MWRVAWVGLVVACEGCTGGCEGHGGGTGGSGGAAGVGRIELDEICDVFIQDLCTVLTECMRAPYCSIEECKGDWACDGMGALRAAVDAGHVIYDPVAAAACHAGLDAAPCEFGSSFLLGVPTVGEALGHCPGVLVGQQAGGDPCTSSADCKEDFDCAGDTCPGECVPWLQEGDACMIADYRCDPRKPLFCNGGVCRRPGLLGDGCSSQADCFPDHWCDMVAGECVDEAELGEACTRGGFGDDAPDCKEGLWCDSLFDIGTCRPRSGPGGQCFHDDDCLDPWTCLPITGLPDLGFCGVRRPVGGTCDSPRDCETIHCSDDTCAASGDCGAGGPCAEGLVCDDDACVPLVCVGEPCTKGASFCNGSCESGMCNPRRPLREPCAGDYHCTSRQCEGGICVDLACAP